MNNDIEYKDFSNKKILCVDDNNLNLVIITKLLQSYNAQVDGYHSGEEVLSALSNGNKYDLYLMDDMMPEMSGTQTMQKMKSEYNITAPTVVVTANTVDGAKEEYLRAGFDLFIPKPINRKELDDALNKFLNN